MSHRQRQQEPGLELPQPAAQAGLLVELRHPWFLCSEEARSAREGTVLVGWRRSSAAGATGKQATGSRQENSTTPATAQSGSLLSSANRHLTQAGLQAVMSPCRPSQQPAGRPVDLSHVPTISYLRIRPCRASESGRVVPGAVSAALSGNVLGSFDASVDVTAARSVLARSHCAEYHASIRAGNSRHRVLRKPLRSGASVWSGVQPSRSPRRRVLGA
jgi:hypothetical protein